MKKKKSLKSTLINVFLSLVIVLLSLLLLFKINFARVVVSGPSMHPTLMGDNGVYEYGYTDRFLFRLGKLDRYDIVVVKVSADRLWIKRIIAMPYETIQIKEGKVYVNGEALEDDTYCEELIDNPGNAASEIKLAKDEYFVLGDNRNHSSDSRFNTLGIVNKKDIYGRGFISRGYCDSLTCDHKEKNDKLIVKGW